VEDDILDWFLYIYDSDNTLEEKGRMKYKNEFFVAILFMLGATSFSLNIAIMMKLSGFI